MINGFLLGVISTSSFVVGLFFLKFWRTTRDGLFLAFAFAFIVEAFNRASLLFINNPNEGNPLVYIVRLVVFLCLLIAIIRKNSVRKATFRVPAKPVA